MRAIACSVLLVVLSSSACTSGSSTAAPSPKSGTPAAFCPVLVDLAVESALAGAAVDDSAGPEVVSGPEFARTRALLGDLIQVAPPRVRELVEAASFEPDEGEVADPDAANAMWTAIAELPSSCTSDQTPECTARLTAFRQEPSSAAPTEAEIASLTEVCSAPPYLAGTDECDALALAILHGGAPEDEDEDEAAGELPILEHFAERCQ